MAGRESRRQLLAPSFLVMTTALACGGQSAGGADEPNPPTNPPVVHEGGSGGAGGSVGGGGFVGIAGVGANPPVTFTCPEQVTPGEACDGRHGPAQAAPSCPYTACGQIVQVSCVNDRWEAPGVACNPPIVSCPLNMPASGASCGGGFGWASSPCGFPTAACPTRTATCVQGAWSVAGCDGGDGGEGGVPSSAEAGQGGASP
jgi:hypothetical protein